MKRESRSNLLLAAGISLGLFSSLGAEGASGVAYTGDTSDTQHAQSVGANASSPGAYADVTMDYTIPDVVAIGVYTSGDITSADGAPLLSGKFIANSKFSIDDEADILNDIVSSSNISDVGSNNDRLVIYGVVYSSSGAGTLTVEPITEGSTAANFPANRVNAQFDNQTNSGSLDVSFYGSFYGSSTGSLLGDSSSITNVGSTAMDANNQANFILVGDVHEDTVTNADDTGVYEGGVRVTITSL